jgi:hypothetical protein
MDHGSPSFAGVRRLTYKATLFSSSTLTWTYPHPHRHGCALRPPRVARRRISGPSKSQFQPPPKIHSDQLNHFLANHPPPPVLSPRRARPTPPLGACQTFLLRRCRAGVPRGCVRPVGRGCAADRCERRNVGGGEDVEGVGNALGCFWVSYLVFFWKGRADIFGHS